MPDSSTCKFSPNGKAYVKSRLRSIRRVDYNLWFFDLTISESLFYKHRWKDFRLCRDFVQNWCARCCFQVCLHTLQREADARGGAYSGALGWGRGRRLHYRVCAPHRELYRRPRQISWHPSGHPALRSRRPHKAHQNRPRLRNLNQPHENRKCQILPDRPTLL